MAIVLDAFASYVGDLLKKMAEDEVGMLLGVSGEIDKLEDKLGRLKDFLADAERRRITDLHVQRWVRELKGAMYDVTDILDLCQLKAIERGGPSKDILGCLNPLLFCLRHPLFSHNIGNRIKALNTRLDNICKNGAQFNFIKLEAYQEHRVSQPSAVGRKTDSVLGRSVGLVGEKIEEDTRALVERLTTKDHNAAHKHTVIAIVGIGGIGKTTLAKKVFNDEAIQHEFDKKIWLSVTQDFEESEMLRTAIVAANEADLPGAGDRSLLVPALVNAIRDKKFFLVLDDMWSNREWNDLLKAPFSHGAAGSMVLVTTRHDTVARGMQAVQPFHHVDKLGREDAWSLLKNQVASTEKDELEIESTLKNIGLEIVDKCGGLPLAVKVMGGLLCQREKRQTDWEKVLRDSIWSVSQMPQEINCTVYLSYEDLSPCLKQCFLHYSLLSILPKNTNFNRSTIVGMWISEGFLHGNAHALEELGSEYYDELISRNLIEPVTGYTRQSVCTMHDVVRSFAQHVARDEALVVSSAPIGNSAITSQKFIRLSIETKEVQSSEELGWRFLQEKKSLRTLISVGELNFKPDDSFIAFSSLRTLHVENANFAAFVESLHQLKHLRYISIICSDISKLPENTGKMIFLQFISVKGCGNLMKLPESIVKLGNLRYLNLSDTSITAGIPRGFGDLTNMRKLYGFPAYMDMGGDWCSLEELGPLSQLRFLSLTNLENVFTASYAAKARLSEKAHLATVFLSCASRLGDDGLVKLKDGEQDVPKEEEQQQIEEVFDALCPPPCSLEYIFIDGYFGRQVPRWMTWAAYERLSIVTMSDLACCTQLPDGLCQLPCLRFFQVNRAPAIKRVGPEFIKLQPSTASHQAFPRLQEMNLVGMVEWEEWEWEWDLGLEQPSAAANLTSMQRATAIPALEKLLIDGCKLRRLPPALASQARALTKLSVQRVQHLNSLESFSSLVELFLFKNLELERIAHLPRLRKLSIVICPRLKVVEGVPALQSLLLEDYRMKALPEYLLQDEIKPSHLVVLSSFEILASIVAEARKAGREWNKLRHVQHVKAYARENLIRKWYVLYTRETNSIHTNVVNTTES